MTVESQPIRPAPPPKLPKPSSGDIGSALLTAGLVIVSVLAAAFFWVLNGAFSIVGSELLAKVSPFTTALWQLIATSKFDTGVMGVLGFERYQPTFFWIGVAGVSLVQLGAFIITFSGRTISRGNWVGLLLLSLYDLGTTLRGVWTLNLVQSFGVLRWPVAVIFTVVLTFGVEFVIGRALSKILRKGGAR